MPILPGKCPQCGADLKVESANESGVCPFCGSSYYVERAINQYYTTNNNNYIIQNAIINKGASDNTESRKKARIEKIVYYVQSRDYENAEKECKTFEHYWPTDFRGNMMYMWISSFQFVIDIELLIKHDLGFVAKQSLTFKQWLVALERENPNGLPFFHENIGLHYIDDIISNIKIIDECVERQKEVLLDERKRLKKTQKSSSITILIFSAIATISFVLVMVGMFEFIDELRIAGWVLFIASLIIVFIVVIFKIFLSSKILYIEEQLGNFMEKAESSTSSNIDKKDHKHRDKSNMNIDGLYKSNNTTIKITNQLFTINSNEVEINKGYVKREGSNIVLHTKDNKKMTFTKQGEDLVSLKGVVYKKQ